MKKIEEALDKAIYAATYTPGTDDGSYKGGFIHGLEYAQELIDKYKNDAINEILTKYHEWAYNLPPAKFADWDDEEGDREKTKARIRKEFIKFLNNK